MGITQRSSSELTTQPYSSTNSPIIEELDESHVATMLEDRDERIKEESSWESFTTYSRRKCSVAGASSNRGPKSCKNPDECIIKGMENLFIAMIKEDYGKNEVDLRCRPFVMPNSRSIGTDHPPIPCFYMSPGSMRM
ncbi:hypothetical protein HAX54_030636 [Datura stramonium]|uniref:Uncharacterized protein n=1 Tax=Datura stramonium TaxID=4076 RepID=A0ABS8V8B3_DATST|nr:hypothetical protein [Datura stramonium]